MANENTPFTMGNYDLGTDSYFGLPREAVDTAFRAPNIDTSLHCIYCGGTPEYKLIPKGNQPNTAEIEDKGYVCGVCLPKYVNSKHFGIRELKR